AAMSSITSTCLSVNFGREARSASYMARSYSAPAHRAIDRKEYFDGLRRNSTSVDEARLVPAVVRGGQFLLVERTNPAQQLELVAKVGAHHLRTVRCDRERDAVVDERPERVPHGVLVRKRLRQEVRRGANLEHDLRIAQRGHQLLIAGGQDPVPDPVGA